MTDEELNKVARKVIDLLADDKYKNVSHLVHDALNTKFSEDLRLTMLGAVEDHVSCEFYNMVHSAINMRMDELKYDPTFKYMIDDVINELSVTYGTRLHEAFNNVATKDDYFNLFDEIAKLKYGNNQ